MRAVIETLEVQVVEKPKEPEQKKSKSNDSNEVPIDSQGFAAYLKKELGQMIDDKQGVGTADVKAKIQDVAVATNEGFKEVELEKEAIARKEWQEENRDCSVAVMAPDGKARLPRPQSLAETVRAALVASHCRPGLRKNSKSCSDAE